MKQIIDLLIKLAMAVIVPMFRVFAKRMPEEVLTVVDDIGDAAEEELRKRDAEAKAAEETTTE